MDDAISCTADSALQLRSYFLTPQKWLKVRLV